MKRINLYLIVSVIFVLMLIPVCFAGVTPTAKIIKNVTKVNLSAKNITSVNSSAKNTSANVSGPIYNMNLNIGQPSSIALVKVQPNIQPYSGGTTGGSESENSFVKAPVDDSSVNGGSLQGGTNGGSSSPPVFSMPTFGTSSGTSGLFSKVDPIAPITVQDRIPGVSDVIEIPSVLPVYNYPPKGTLPPTPVVTWVGPGPSSWESMPYNCWNGGPGVSGVCSGTGIDTSACVNACIEDHCSCPGGDQCEISSSLACICKSNPNDPACPCVPGKNDNNPNCKCHGTGIDTSACVNACIEDSRSCPGRDQCEISSSLACTCMKNPNNPACPCVPGKNDDNPNCKCLGTGIGTDACTEACVKDSRSCPSFGACEVSLAPGCICKSNPNDPSCPCVPGKNDANPNCKCLGTGIGTEACAEACVKDSRSCPSYNRCEVSLAPGCICKSNPNDPSCPCVPGKNDANPNCQVAAVANNIDSCKNPTTKQCYDFCINQPDSQWCKENIDCLNDPYSPQCKTLCEKNSDSYACAYCGTTAGKNDPICNNINMCIVAPSGTMCKEYCSKHPDDVKCLPVKSIAGPCSKPTSKECSDYCWAKSPLDYPECNKVKTIACSDPKSETCTAYCKAKPGAYGCPISLNQSIGSSKSKVTPALVVKLNVTTLSVVKKTA